MRRCELFWNIPILIIVFMHHLTLCHIWRMWLITMTIGIVVMQSEWRHSTFLLVWSVTKAIVRWQLNISTSPSILQIQPLPIVITSRWARFMDRLPWFFTNNDILRKNWKYGKKQRLMQKWPVIPYYIWFVKSTWLGLTGQWVLKKELLPKHETIMRNVSDWDI